MKINFTREVVIPDTFYEIKFTDGTTTKLSALTEDQIIQMGNEWTGKLLKQREKEIALEYGLILSNKVDEKNQTYQIGPRISEIDGLSTRTINCLWYNKILYLYELTAMKRGDVLKFRNFGIKCLKELESAMASLNIKFKE